ncbi:hypothetical protein OH77DRAFT_1022974 [Trametes cingulata]|nr:hypothetical protein OH77DRAFT_1022974 [Trametes cingulata]
MAVVDAVNRACLWAYAPLVSSCCLRARLGYVANLEYSTAFYCIVTSNAILQGRVRRRQLSDPSDALMNSTPPRAAYEYFWHILLSPLFSQTCYLVLSGLLRCNVRYLSDEYAFAVCSFSADSLTSSRTFPAAASSPGSVRCPKEDRTDTLSSPAHRDGGLFRP